MSLGTCTNGGVTIWKGSRMNDELEDWCSSLANKELFDWRLNNITNGYLHKNIGWIYHEGDLFDQIYYLVADQKLLFYDDDYQEKIEDVKQPRYYTDLWMNHLLKGDYKPEMLHPSISNRKLYPRKRKKRDVERDQARQLKRLSRFVTIPL